VVCANIGRSSAKYGKRGELYAVQDASAAAMNMMLMALDLGLGTCWVGAFDEQAVSRLLGIPQGVRPVMLMPLGFPDESPNAPPRLGEKLEHQEKW
jgi:nitroreductase